MKRIKRPPRALVCGFLAGTCMLVSVPLAQAQVPTPDRDPFYAAPSGIDGLANGAILDSRPIQAQAMGVPMPAHAWQVKYKTIDNLGRSTATVTTVMVPNSAWNGPGPRPLVSYQTAEDGVDTKCSSSYALSSGVQALGTNAESETLLMLAALQQGWSVAAPDYEGPQSQFTGVQMSAHGVLDGLRAALAFKPAGVAPGAPLALWGYSGGALASAWAAQLQSKLTPELRLAGVALGGVVADLKTTFLAFNGGPGGGALPMALSGVDRSYPQVNILQYLNTAGRQTVAASAHDCIADGIIRYPFWNFTGYEARPDVIDDPALTAFMTSISPATMSLAPTGSVYMYTSQTDEYAPLGPALRLAARYCAAGVTVDQVTAPPSEHIAESVIGAHGALGYLADRFAGKPALDTCPPSSRSPTTTRPGDQVRYRLRVTPATAVHSKRTRFMFIASRALNGHISPVAGTIVRFAGRLARTDRAGRAQITATLHRQPRWQPARLRVAGRTVTTVLVRVR